jgi:hypothetical protein
VSVSNRQDWVAQSWFARRISGRSLRFRRWP